MPVLTRTFRVFVSSTFEDLKEERNALQREAKPDQTHHEVFPALRKLCEAHGARFQAIDLRWGVRDEAALDQKTIEICLREIERCQRTGLRPNFIVLLGQRYGWRPLPARIEAQEFETVRAQVVDSEDRALVESWYRRDDNAVPPEYLLKPRTGEWVEREQWEPLEARLHRILLNAARAAALPAQALVKYEVSATHQEILKGLGATPEDRRHVFVFCRQVPDNACGPGLLSLKDFLRAQLPAENIRLYNPNDLEGLCEDVERTLRAVIESQAAGFESRPALALEIEAHDAFARERAFVFGRDEVLGVITDYVRAGGDRPLVLYGASGCGKSAVMAQASELTGAALPHAVVVRRFIGVTPESSSGLTLLRSLCEQIGEAYRTAGELPADFNGVVRVFRERLGLATSESPLVVFVDALDQFRKDDPACSLDWLSGTLPPHCRIVVSTTERVPALNECERRELGSLAEADAATALDHWLTEAHRQLQSAQRRHLLGAYSRCGLALYLKLAFEEARGWASYQTAEQCPLGEGVEGVIDALLNRLSLETNHGPLLVSRGLGYLAAARYGLTEDEMLGVLSADGEVWRDFEHRAHHTPPEHRLPVIVWSRLFLDLEPYLAERSVPGGTVASFYHRQLAEQVATRFLAGDAGHLRHRSLAAYFAGRTNWLDEQQTRPDVRRAAEMPYQQRAGGLWTEAEATLLDCPFLFAKCTGGLVLDLDADYQGLIQEAPENSLPQHDALRLVQSTLELCMHVVAPDPKQFGSQITGRLLAHAGQPAIAAFLANLNAYEPRPRLRPLRPTLTPAGGPMRRVLAGHTGEVLAVALTPDGKCAVSASHRTLRVWDLETGHVLRTLSGGATSVAVTPDGHCALAAAPSTRGDALTLWDLRAGRVLRTLGGPCGANRVAVTPDGQRAVAAFGATLRVYDLEAGRVLRDLRVWNLEPGQDYHEEHFHAVNDVAVTPDSQRAISASLDNTLKMWDLETGRELRTLTGGGTSVVVTPDGKRAVSASYGETLKVWDLETGACLRTLGKLEGQHVGRVHGVAVTPDGKRAVSACDDKTLRVWDLETDRALGALKGHAGPVHGVAVTPDGQFAVSASADGTLKVWHLGTGNALSEIEGHCESVQGFAVTPDRQRIVSASSDGTLKVWDVETGRALRTLEGGIKVSCMAVMADGQRAVAASSSDDMLMVWDLESGRALRRRYGWRHVAHGVDLGHGVPVWLGGQLAVSQDMIGVTVWDLETDRVVCRAKGVGWVAMTPNGESAIFHRHYALTVWDLQGNEPTRVLEGRPHELGNVAFAPDGKRVVARSRDGTMRVWDLEGNQPPRVLESHQEGHESQVMAVELTADGKCAVSASRDGTLRVWELDGNQPPRVLEGHAGEVNALELSADSKRAVSGCDDKTVRVWDLDTGKCLAAFTCDAAVHCCAWARGHIAAGDAVGRVHFLAWDE